MKVIVEFKDSDGEWKQAGVDARPTRNFNLVAKFMGRILVFPALREGSEVVELRNGKWAKVGRITRYRVAFLGADGELSFSEKADAEFARKNPATLEELLGIPKDY